MRKECGDCGGDVGMLSRPKVWGLPGLPGPSTWRRLKWRRGTMRTWATSSMRRPSWSSKWRPCRALATPWLREAGAELLWGLSGLSTCKHLSWCSGPSRNRDGEILGGGCLPLDQGSKRLASLFAPCKSGNHYWTQWPTSLSASSFLHQSSSRQKPNHLTSRQDCRDDQASVPKFQNWNNCQGCWGFNKSNIWWKQVLWACLTLILRGQLAPRRFAKIAVIAPVRRLRNEDVF